MNPATRRAASPCWPGRGTGSAIISSRPPSPTPRSTSTPFARSATASRRSRDRPRRPRCCPAGVSPRAAIAIEDGLLGAIRSSRRASRQARGVGAPPSTAPMLRDHRPALPERRTQPQQRDSRSPQPPFGATSSGDATDAQTTEAFRSPHHRGMRQDIGTPKRIRGRLTTTYPSFSVRVSRRCGCGRPQRHTPRPSRLPKRQLARHRRHRTAERLSTSDALSLLRALLSQFRTVSLE